MGTVRVLTDPYVISVDRSRGYGGARRVCKMMLGGLFLPGMFPVRKIDITGMT
jgi:hypothetical protein